MVSESFVVKNESGLHLRPAAKLSEAALEFHCRVTLRHGTAEANAKSVLGVLGACLRCGDTFTLDCDGPDEEAALEELRRILEDI